METTTIIIITIICICISSSIGIGIYLSSLPPGTGIFEIPLVILQAGLLSSSSGDTKKDEKKDEKKEKESTSGTSGTSGTSVFKVIGSSDTAFDDEGGGRSDFLTRQDINCKDNAIKRFHLSRGDGSGKIKYVVSCSSGDLGSSTKKNTELNDWGGGNTQYLAKHNIDCGSDSVLTQYRLIKPENTDKIRYDYTCKKSNKPLTCRDVETPPDEVGGGSTSFFDRHNVECKDDEVLSQFRLNIPTGNPNQIQYKYKCCKY